ncbi:death on curing protein [Abditibacterium utsteinense]|uniref:Death on curing protein n=1 Tax=Abditibacterium utsteinense TaxID=1960156 RepID=A0A2S8SRP5_9BACT|nr:type II toxin-antitoxin system death-on-curing family toxin [Abditibacterium utsteinense]PQV63455.1 death on curing protein [Abditibacterium utsteinense]
MNFFDKDEIMALHEANIARFGGSLGLRDEGALLSALEAPGNRAYYESADEVTCAATYGFHLCQAHAFVDGNKRIAAVACELFLRDNGIRLNWTNEEVIATFLAVASSKMTRDELEALVRSHVV